MISRPKPWITVITIPKETIIDFNVSMGINPVEKMSAAYERLDRPDVMLNGGFFDMKTGETSSNLVVDGKREGTGCSSFGLMKMRDGRINFSNIAPDYSLYEDFIGGTPSLIKNGKIDIDGDYGTSFNGKNPRSAVGDDKGNLYLVAVDGRRSEAPGMTLQELAEFMLSIGCQNAINLDGGGSTRLLVNGQPANKPTEDRPVNNFLCIYLKENEKGAETMHKVFIDPGHGGADPGAAANGIVEKDINLTVAKKLKELLEDRGIYVAMSREEDTYIGLRERCDMANKSGSHIFVSIHHNAGGGIGAEVIHTIHTDKSQGDELAEYIGREITKSGQNIRRIFSRESTVYPGTDYYSVIAGTKMPAVITEYAFLDTEDYKKVDTKEELHKEAEAIYRGICHFFDINPAQDESKFDKLINELKAVIQKYE